MTLARLKNSTNGRLKLRAISAAARAASRVSAELSGALAGRAFLTTVRRPARSDERQVLEQAERLEVRLGRERIAGYSWGEGPVALLAHGWNGAAAQLTPLVGALVGRGMRVVAFDAPGHGESSGSLCALPTMADAALAVASEVGGRVRFAVAHSLGGAALTVALARGLRVERAAMVAPPIGPQEWMKTFAQALSLSPGALEPMREWVEGWAGFQLQELDTLTLARAMSTPLLVIHDQSDREVPICQGEALAHSWPGAKLWVTEGLGHRRILRDREVIAGIVAFAAAEPLAAQASGG